jgi:hypothetical protein
MAHHAHQSAVAGASSLIVFSVNLYGITGIVPVETDVKTKLTRLETGEINFHLFDDSSGYFRKENGSRYLGILRQWERKFQNTKLYIHLNTNLR